MTAPWRVPDNVVPVCPECQADLIFVCSWPSPGAWGYDVVRTYECPTHGPMFITPDTPVSTASVERQPDGGEDGGRDYLATARRNPKPLLDSDACAVPEPDPEPDSN